VLEVREGVEDMHGKRHTGDKKKEEWSEIMVKRRRESREEGAGERVTGEREEWEEWVGGMT
jgi:hypothetical protein